MGFSVALCEDSHGESSASGAEALTAEREGGSREAAEYPQMPGEGMLGSEKRGQWDKRAFHMASGGRGHEEEESQMCLCLIHISEATRLRRISYAVFCLKKKKETNKQTTVSSFIANYRSLHLSEAVFLHQYLYL